MQYRLSDRTNPTAVHDWSSDAPFRATISVSGPNSFGATPPGVGSVSYYDPYSNSVKVSNFTFGGNSNTKISVITGSLYGKGVGQLKVTLRDNPDFPLGTTGFEEWGGDKLGGIFKTIGRVLGVVGAFDDGITGVFGATSGYVVRIDTSNQEDVFKVQTDVDYAPGVLESYGIDPQNLPFGLGSVDKVA